MSHEEDSCHENDLPLMANVQDILVYHYILDLRCHFEDKMISGSVVVCCKPTANYDTHNGDIHTDSKRIPDCHDETSKYLPTNSLLPNSSSLTSLTDSEVLSPFSTNTNNEDNFGSKEVNSVKMSPLRGSLVSDSSDSFINKKLLLSSGECVTTDHSDFPHFKISSGSKNSEKERCICDRKRKSFPSDGLDETTVTEEVIKNEEAIYQDHISKEKTQSMVNKSRSPSVVHSAAFSNDSIVSEFQMILDCCDINILNVQDLTGCEEILDQVDQISEIKRFGNNKNLDTNTLSFIVEKHCLRVFKPGCSNIKDFPKMMKITFLTKPEGQSLKWTVDKDGKPCVYTHGNWINNRSLFPSQDAPISMATWQAVVSVEGPVEVVMSGDKDPVISTTEDGWTHFYYHTQMAMPSSTISLAIGHWCVSSLINLNKLSEPELEKTIPCRLFCASSVIAAARVEIGQYIESCLRAAYDTLGPHPFQRLDIVVVPSSFDSLGMASPSMLYLSQSVLVGDFSMCVRIAHEVSHSWFGLAIGPSDWTEEWLTEGFCTYTEDIIHNLAMQTVGTWTQEYGDHHREIRDLLRYRTLVAELEHTVEELQTLRPNKEDDHDDSSIAYVKNGMNPDKRFMQVHYLKGYFLLRYLEGKAGRKPFLRAMKDYVQQFNGRLVSSREVLSFFLGKCSELQEEHITEAEISSEWLDSPGIPKNLQHFQMDKDNIVANQVFDEVKDLADISRYRKGSRKKWQQKRQCLMKPFLLSVVVTRDLAGWDGKDKIGDR